eukprot:15338703-Alexandrium_andersonii.AAC.1
MARRQDTGTTTEHGVQTGEKPQPEDTGIDRPANVGSHLGEVAEEWGRKGRDPTYAPKFNGCRLADVQ